MNFETLIREALAKGMSPEAIAAGFTEAMNKAEESNKSKEKDNFITAVRAAVKAAIDQGKWTFDAATNVLILTAVADHEDWDLNTLKNYKNSMLESIKGTDKLFRNALKGDTSMSFNDCTEDWIDTMRSVWESLDDNKLKRFLKRF